MKKKRGGIGERVHDAGYRLSLIYGKGRKEEKGDKKINYRHRLTQKKRAMPLKIAPSPIKEKISVNPCLKEKEVIVYMQ